MKAITLLLAAAGFFVTPSDADTVGWRKAAQGSDLVTDNSVISGFHKYVCKPNYSTLAPFGALVYDQGKMMCENYNRFGLMGKTNKESSAFQVLEASAPNAYKWAPVAVRDPILLGLAKPFGKDDAGNDVYICRTFTPDTEDTISGSYMLVNQKWACFVGLPDGPYKVELNQTAAIDLLILS